MPWPALAALAVALVGHPVDVRCATVYEWPDRTAATLGASTRAYTWFDGQKRPTFTVYGPEVCGYMVLLVADPDDRTRLNGAGARAREGQAALTFLHELEHQRLATQDEGVVECAAVSALPGLFESLGVRKPGPLLAAARAFHFAKPAAYRTVC
jgi:hypothetical protein